MTKQKLNLFQVADSLPAELRASTTRPCGASFASEVKESITDDRLPNGFLVGDQFARHPIRLVHRPEDIPFINLAATIYSSIRLYGGGYGDGAEAVAEITGHQEQNKDVVGTMLPFQTRAIRRS